MSHFQTHFKPSRSGLKYENCNQMKRCDGSLSGARTREAISWGKMRPEAPNVCVEGDASVLLPLLGADLFNGD